MNLEALIVMWVVWAVQVQTALLLHLVQIINGSLARLVQISSLVHCLRRILLRTTTLNLRQLLRVPCILLLVDQVILL